MVAVLAAVFTGEGTVLSSGAVVVLVVVVPLGMVKTGKVSEVCEWSTVSVAVTVTLVWVPAVTLEPVASMWITPLGLVVESVDEVIVTGVSGVVLELPPTATLVMS